MFPTAPRVAAAVLGLSAFGRMYWRAHHVLDVSAGAGLAFGAHRALGRLGVGPASCGLVAPFAAVAAVFPALRALSTWKAGP